MSTINRDVKERFWWIACLAAISVSAVAYHALIVINYGDDVSYYKTALSGISYREFLVLRWNTWSSRTLIEGILAWIVNHELIWRAIDIVFFVSMGLLMGRLTQERELGCLVILLYPFHQMSCAGWISTTTNYFWPLWCALVLCVSLKKCVLGEKVRWYEYVWALPVALYACNQEQTAAVMFGITGLCLVLCLLRDRRISLYVGLLLAVETVSLVWIAVCPGNRVRALQEVANYAESFEEMSFGMKLYMGLYNVDRLFVTQVNPVFFPIAVILMVLVYKLTGHFIKTGIAAIPFVLQLAHALLPSAMPRVGALFQRTIATTYELDLVGLYVYCIPIYLAAIIGSMLYSLYLILGDKKECFWSTIVILGAGFASAVVMGFSPTLFASGERTMLFFCFTLLYTGLVCIRRGREQVRVSGTEKWFYGSMAAFWIGANVVNELLSILMLRSPWLF